VDAVLKKAREKVAQRVGFFAVVEPGYLQPEHDEAEKFSDFAKRELAIANGFWRSLGFRRVGTSSWFARAESPSHPSRLLQSSQDWDQPLPREAPGLSDALKGIFEKLDDLTVAEAECIGELQKLDPINSGDQQWLKVDRDGNTLLHIAAMSLRPEVIKFILSKALQLTNSRNKEGYTPLEALRERMESMRTRLTQAMMVLVISDEFTGFSERSIACVAALQNATPFDLSSVSASEICRISYTMNAQSAGLNDHNIGKIWETLRIKYGCTCGRCIGGYLSPRMSLALVSVAEIQHDMLNQFMDESGIDWVELYNSELLAHVSSPVRENMKTNKSMRQGFTNICDHFAECLRRHMIPSTKNVVDLHLHHMKEWPPVTKNFYERGGTVASVANMIFEHAMDRDEWAGDGDFRDGFGSEIDTLPPCRNDHEFGFVAGMCGYKRVRPSSSRFVIL
jgi:hypothetical protein